MDESDEDLLTLSAVVVAAVAIMRRKRRQQRRSCWVRSWLSCRQQLGCHEALLPENLCKRSSTRMVVADTN